MISRHPSLFKILACIAKQRCSTPSRGCCERYPESAYGVLSSVWAAGGAPRGRFFALPQALADSLVPVCGLSTPLGGIPCTSSSPELRMMSFTMSRQRCQGFQGREGGAGPCSSPAPALAWTAPDGLWSTLFPLQFLPRSQALKSINGSWSFLLKTC